MTLRPASLADAPAVAAIYGHHVLHGLGTFEEVPPTDAEIGERMAAVLALGLPYLLAEDEVGRVVGFAYAGPFRSRAAYRYTAEDSVYVHPDFIGRGVGRQLLRAVIDACETIGLRQLVAVIGDSGNAGSRGLHAALGFTETGIGRAVGYKHGRWVDIVWMQRALGRGEAAPPDGPGVPL